jgi:argininosuccinate synthase
MSHALSPNPNRVILAYSGGLDTTVILHWLVSKGYEVIAFLADIGQRTEDLEKIAARAHQTGASEFGVAKLSEEYLSDFFLPCLQANSQYEGRYQLGTSIARPLIAKEQVNAAHRFGAQYVTHGATGKGNEQVRFELTYQALDPSLGILPIWRNPQFIAQFSEGRKSMFSYVEQHGLEVKASTKQPCSPLTAISKRFASPAVSSWKKNAACQILQPWFTMAIGMIRPLRH